MTEPIIENISANIATTLAGVTVANGYHQTLTVKRSRRSDFEDIAENTYTAILIQEEETDRQGPYGLRDQAMNYSIAVLVLDDDRTTDAIDTLKNRVRSDIEKALRVDPTRGGYAIDTVLKPPVNFTHGIAVQIEVWYRTNANNPYSQT